MADMRPPEEVLYAFSRWLQQWAEYAQVQAEQFAGSATPPAPEEGQPPAHWLELVRSGPPVHWLALFEEYGLEPPQMEFPPDGMQTGIQTPGPAPRPLQDWLGDFQRGLAQFREQPVPLISDPPPENAGDAVPIPAPAVDQPSPGDSHLSRPQEETVPTHSGEQLKVQETGDEHHPLDSATSKAEAFLPVTPTAGQEAGNFPSPVVSTLQDLAVGEWLSPPSQTGLKRQPASHEIEPGIPIASSTSPLPSRLPPASRMQMDTASSPSPVERAEARLPSALVAEQTKDTAPSPRNLTPPTTFSSPPYQREASQLTAPVSGIRNDSESIPAETRQREGVETRSAPIRLHLDLPAPSGRPVPVPSEPQNTIADTRPVPEQPPLATHPVPRLTIGIPLSKSKPLSVQPAPLVDGIGESPQVEEAPPPASVAALENIQPRLNLNETDLLTQNDLDSPHPPIGRKEAAFPLNSYQTRPNEQPPPEWSQPAKAHWPELPERLPPVKPPFNVLAEPTHRLRIDREQRGRSWSS